MVLVRDGLAAEGHTVLTFNYPYTERGAKRPDSINRLLECHRAAAAFLRLQVDHIFLAGRSMGGRMATYLVAEGEPATGVVLYAYPLHPAGNPEKLRVDHLAQIRVPMLFFQGSKDALARPELFDRYIRPLPGVEVVILEGAGHSPRGGGWTVETTAERLVSRTGEWISRILSGKSPAQQS